MGSVITGGSPIVGGGGTGAAGGITASAAAIAAISVLAGNAALGDVTISAGTTTLADNPHYNNLIVDGTLVARGWMIFARKVTVNATGIIHWDGGAAAAAVAGAAFTAGYLSANAPGIAGGVGAGGAAAAAASTVMLPRSGVQGTVFKGGVGGLGSGGAGGAAGTQTAGSQGRQGRHRPMDASAATNWANTLAGPFGGSGGGAGGGDTTNSGGGGGAGGGFGFIFAGEVLVNAGGQIRSLGGAGGNAAAGNCGGGGGGGGGIVIITCGLYTGAVPLVTGGIAGTKQGTGVDGSAGNDGDYYINQFKAS